jgi:hypothetical protein
MKLSNLDTLHFSDSKISLTYSKQSKLSIKVYWIAFILYIPIYSIIGVLDVGSSIRFLFTPIILIAWYILSRILPQSQTKKTIKITDDKMYVSSWYWTDVYLLKNIFNLKAQEMNEQGYGIVFNYRILKNEIRVYRNLSKEDAEKIVDWIPQSHFGV